MDALIINERGKQYTDYQNNVQTESATQIFNIHSKKREDEGVKMSEEERMSTVVCLDGISIIHKFPPEFLIVPLPQCKKIHQLMIFSCTSCILFYRIILSIAELFCNSFFAGLPAISAK